MVQQSQVGVGLIGCGAIGRDMATTIHSGDVPGAGVVALFDVEESQGNSLAATLGDPGLFHGDLDKFLDVPGLDLVVECASGAAVRASAERVLEKGKDLMVMSTGALLDEALMSRLSELAAANGRKLLAPSGAIGGIDAIRAGGGLLEEVAIITTKPPEGLKGSPGFADWEGKEITAPQVIYEGPAVDGVKLFPANTNVAATLSLAGLGPDKTKMKVIADPKAPGNVHEIQAKGSFGVMRLSFENRPHPNNPKTSYLAILSAIELLRKACAPGPQIGT